MLNLKELSNDELQAILDSPSGKGRTPIYPPVIVQVIEASKSKTTVAAFAIGSWTSINADAKSDDENKSPRDVVIAGLNAATSRNKASKGRLKFRPSSADETTINVVVKPVTK